MNRESKLIKSTFILSIGTFLPKLAAFVTLPILTGFLSKEQYGTYDLVTVLVSLILPATTLQIHTAVFRFLIEHKNDRNLAKVYFSNIIAFVIPISIITLTILFFILPVNDIEIKIWICLYFFFDTLVCEAGQLTRGLARNLDYSISSIISALTKLVLAFILVRLLKYELKGAIIALAFSPLLSLIYLFFSIKLYELIDLKLLDIKILKEMLLYSWPMVPNNMSGWVMRVSDRFIVTAILGVSVNAVYAVANKLPSLITLAQSTFSLAWQENASIVSSDDDVSEYYSKMFSVMLKLYSGFLGIIIACTPVLFKILIKGDYAEAYLHMPILFVSMFFYCMSSFLGGIYIAFKKTKSVGLTTVFAAILNITIDLLLIGKIGLFAASISTLISYFFIFFYRLIKSKEFIEIRYSPVSIIIPTFMLIVESILFYLNTNISNILNFLLSIIVFIILNKKMINTIIDRLRNILLSHSII